jgi:hypothetical protein
MASTPMDLVDSLREQANILCSLAKSPEALPVRAGMLELAKLCEALASEAERESSEREPQEWSRRSSRDQGLAS